MSKLSFNAYPMKEDCNTVTLSGKQYFFDLNETINCTIFKGPCNVPTAEMAMIQCF